MITLTGEETEAQRSCFTCQGHRADSTARNVSQVEQVEEASMCPRTPSSEAGQWAPGPPGLLLLGFLW